MCKTGWQALGFKSYQDYLMSDMWKEKRDWFLKNNPNCQMCKDKATEVHHKTYERCGNEPRGDLMALCRRCHMKVHNLK